MPERVIVLTWQWYNGHGIYIVYIQIFTYYMYMCNSIPQELLFAQVLHTHFVFVSTIFMPQILAMCIGDINFLNRG